MTDDQTRKKPAASAIPRAVRPTPAKPTSGNSLRVPLPLKRPRPAVPPPKATPVIKAFPVAKPLASPVVPKDVNERLQQLVRLSRINGYVTIQNINEVIPESSTDLELIENIMNILDNLSIKLLHQDEIESFENRIEAIGHEIVLGPTTEAPYDSLEVYLQQVNLKPSTDRAQENELFQHIVDAENRAQDFLFSRWLTLPMQSDLARSLLDNHVRMHEVIDGRKFRRSDNLSSDISTTVHACDALRAQLDSLWGNYLDESDLQLKYKALEIYRKAELDSSCGCKALLRKFCFKMSIFEDWLNGPLVQADLREARRIVDSLDSRADSSLSALLVHDIELKWRLSLWDFIRICEKTFLHLGEVRRAKAEIIENNLRLVVEVANEFEGDGLDKLDLIQEGNIGLVKTVDRYNHARGYAFPAIVRWWVRQVLSRAVACQSRIIRIPVHLAELVDTVVRARKKFVRANGREPAVEELATLLDLPLDRMHECVELARRHALPADEEIDAYEMTNLQLDESRQLECLVAEDPDQDPISATSAQLLRERIDFVLRSLAEREKEVIILRYGLIDGVERTLEEVGRHYRLTRERIRQIEVKALKNLRHPTRLRQLQGYIEDLCGDSTSGFGYFNNS